MNADEAKKSIIASISTNECYEFIELAYKNKLVEWTFELYWTLRRSDDDVKNEKYDLDEFKDNLLDDDSDLFYFLVSGARATKNLQRLRYLLRHPNIEKQQSEQRGYCVYEENVNYFHEIIPFYHYSEAEKERLRALHIDDFPTTILHAVIEEGFYEAVPMIVEETNFNDDVINNHHETPIMTAARHGHLATVQYLFEKGFRTEVRCNDENPWCYCEFKFECNHVNEHHVFIGTNAMLIAAHHGHHDVVTYLAEHDRGQNNKKKKDIDPSVVEVECEC